MKPKSFISAVYFSAAMLFIVPQFAVADIGLNGSFVSGELTGANWNGAEKACVGKIAVKKQIPLYQSEDEIPPNITIDQVLISNADLDLCREIQKDIAISKDKELADPITDFAGEIVQNDFNSTFQVEVSLKSYNQRPAK